MIPVRIGKRHLIKGLDRISIDYLRNLLEQLIPKLNKQLDAFLICTFFPKKTWIRLFFSDQSLFIIPSRNN